MSSFLTPSVYSKNGLENQWMNTIFNTHDLMCGCNDTIKHLFAILKRKGEQLCLPSTTEDAGTQTGGDAQDYDLEEGDLDALFANDFEEDDG
nr:unnamed protein product [TTV-like mini virus]